MAQTNSTAPQKNVKFSLVIVETSKMLPLLIGELPFSTLSSDYTKQKKEGRWT